MRWEGDEPRHKKSAVSPRLHRARNWSTRPHLGRRQCAMVSATKGGAYLKMIAEQAAEATAGLVQLMPEEWRGDPGIPALTGLPNRPDCEPVLKELTRGVPLHMLLDRGEDSLHPKNDRSLLFAPDFFSSTPSDIYAFVSHRWAADPSMTVQGLHMAIILRFLGRLFIRLHEDMFLAPLVHRCLRRWPKLQRCMLRIFVPSLVGWGIMFAFAAPFIFAVPLMYCFLAVLLPYLLLHILDIESKIGRLLFFSKHASVPGLWFDKASVHQTEPCLNQAGIALFPYYLEKAKELWILFTPEYLTRVWCIYELATWLKTKPDAPVFIVPLHRSSRLYRGALRWWPWIMFVLTTGFGLGALGIAIIHQRHSGDFDRIIWAVVSIIIVVFAATFVIAYFVIVWPMRVQRLRIATQLEKFEVNECSAFYEKDKAYVLGLVAQWFGEAGDGDQRAALVRFNELVRTRVAKRLRRTLLIGEAQLAVVFLLLIMIVAAYIVVVVAVRSPPPLTSPIAMSHRFARQK